MKNCFKDNKKQDRDNYFINPELKISSAVLLSIMILFFVFQALIINSYNSHIKDNYAETFGAVVNRISAKSPNLTKDILPIITKKLSATEKLKGKSLMEEMGINSQLEDSLFPTMNEFIFPSYAYGIILLLTITLILLIFNFIQHKCFYKRIREITSASKKVIEGNYEVYMDEHSEGDWSRLAIAFNSMGRIIKNNMYQLNVEKQKLAELMSDISHQLKTPLSSIIIYNDLMLEKELSENQRKFFLDNTKNQLSKMNWLIRNLLKLAKLDAKAINLEKENQSLSDTLEGAINNFISKAEMEGITIEYKCENEVMLFHDKLWLEEAIDNIIKNAIEHTGKDGEIKIDMLENSIYKRIVIADTGEGIKEEDLPHVFERFYKAKTSKKTDSIGIGLALAKSIIEAHDGIIEVESKEHEGTKFIITFLKY